MQARLISTVAVGLAAVVSSGRAVQARATFTDFTGNEICNPISMGQWTFPDGNIHIRGLVLMCTETSTTPLYGGPNIVMLNANLKADSGAPFLGGVGPIWGTWQMDDWAGTWEGAADPTGAVYHANGHGTGPREGMKLQLRGDHGATGGRIVDVGSVQ
jgi:hypothetical protein